jgi:hypothetical protein
MTLPLDCWGAACTGGAVWELGNAKWRRKRAREEQGEQWRSERGQATENFMSPGLSAFFGFDGAAALELSAPFLLDS